MSIAVYTAHPYL